MPITSPPIKDGIVLTDGKAIKAVGSGKELSKFPYDEIIDCSGKIILPGFVNAHSHLELTGFRGKIEKGLPFTDWARKVVSIRKDITENEIATAIKDGVDELISSGVTTVGDFSQTGITAKILNERGLRGTVFLEFSGFNPEQKDEKLRQLKELLNYEIDSKLITHHSSLITVNFGIAPHAPYSVSPELLKESHNFAQEKRLPLAIHISEMLEEIEFIKNGSGAMKDLLIDFGVWNDKWMPPQTTPVQYLQNMGILKGAIGIHLNIVTEDDIRILKENDVSVVYCPGSNKWFGRNWKYPLREFLNNDINVVIGTDSLLSNEKLNMFYEMRVLKENFPDLENDIILKMATVNGAKAIGFEGEAGEIAVGRKADIIGIDI
ncbi:MAG TPA: amidohydrolase family protein, partial [Nitrospinota bacterium]|nr:amidohydrolase family protein [Nitrospinota bacterium]